MYRIKLSPCGGYNDLFFNSHEAVLETFHYYIEQLDALGLAYIQVMQYNAYGDNKWDGAPQGFDHDVVKEYGHLVKKSNCVANCGYDGPKAEKELAERGVKAVTFGQAFIANPDYYRRLQEDLELNQPDYQVSRPIRWPLMTDFLHDWRRRKRPRIPRLPFCQIE